MILSPAFLVNVTPTYFNVLTDLVKAHLSMLGFEPFPTEPPRVSWRPGGVSQTGTVCSDS